MSKPHVVIAELDHKKGTELSARWKAEGLGTLTYGDIYRAGLKALESKIKALAKNLQKAN